MIKKQGSLDLDEPKKLEEHECQGCAVVYTLEYIDADGTQLAPEFCPFCGDYAEDPDDQPESEID